MTRKPTSQHADLGTGLIQAPLRRETEKTSAGKGGVDEQISTQWWAETGRT